jgi:hypothetical protein
MLAIISAKSFVFQFAIKKYKDHVIYNFACCFVWVCNLVAHNEKHRLRVFENKVLRRIFGPKSDEVTGEWRKLHNEELYDLYSPTIIQLINHK